MKRDHLSELELFVITAVVRLDDEAYGVKIKRLIEERARRRVNIGTVYATLARLESRGLLDTWMARPEAHVPGARARRYCRTTPKGDRLLAATADAVGRMLSGLDLASTDET